jgi:hypothetical protein
MDQFVLKTNLNFWNVNLEIVVNLNSWRSPDGWR